MATPVDHDAAPPDPQPAPTTSRSSAGKWIGAALLAVGCIGVAALVAISSGAIKLPGAANSSDGSGSQSSAQEANEARLTAADERWASATCTNIIVWKNELQRDEAGLGFSLSSVSRIEDAITATTHMLSEVKQLGLPPSVHGGQAQAAIEQLRSDLETRVKDIEGAAGSVASGNLAAIGTLIGDLKNYKGLGTQMLTDLRHAITGDLAISLVEAQPCRQLVGVKI